MARQIVKRAFSKKRKRGGAKLEKYRSDSEWRTSAGAGTSTATVITPARALTDTNPALAMLRAVSTRALSSMSLAATAAARTARAVRASRARHATSLRAPPRRRCARLRARSLASALAVGAAAAGRVPRERARVDSWRRPTTAPSRNQRRSPRPSTPIPSCTSSRSGFGISTRRRRSSRGCAARTRARDALRPRARRGPGVAQRELRDDAGTLRGGRAGQRARDARARVSTRARARRCEGSVAVVAGT